jgi:ELWxxDGT repeat protein
VKVKVIPSLSLVLLVSSIAFLGASRTALGGAQRMTNINPSGQTNIYETVEYNGALYFGADDGVHGQELWKFDGTSASLVADPNVNSYYDPRDFAVLNNSLHFVANQDTIYRLDGNSPATVASTAGEIFFLTPHDNTLYFRASIPGAGRELARLNGNAIEMAADVEPGAGDAGINWLTSFGSELVFTAESNFVSGGNSEPWKYDGTTATQLAEIEPLTGRSDGSVPKAYTVFQNDLYFIAAHRNTQNIFTWNLWKYDGANVSQITAFTENASGLRGSELSVFDGALYFQADNSISGRELWRFDGSSTSQVADLNAGGGSSPRNFVEHDGKLAFVAYDGTQFNIYQYDGNQVVALEGLGASSAIPVSFNNELYVIWDGGDWSNGQDFYQITSVPEPSSLLLGLAGIVGLMAFRRRRRR